MPHGRHIYDKAYDMAKATMFAYSQSDYESPHWKCVLRCCAKCKSINIPDKETDDQYPVDTCDNCSCQLMEECHVLCNVQLYDKCET